MNKDDTSIYKEYFNITKEYKEKYGERTVLLMQVGSFFEIYGLKTNDNNITEIEPVSQICQFNVSEKKATYKNQQLLMAGFPDYRLDKYLQKITEGGYTVVVFVQTSSSFNQTTQSSTELSSKEKNEKNTKRVFHSVHSIGTYISYETDSSPQITNNIMCIWIENNKTIIHSNSILTCGISVVNIFTGKSNIFQYQTQYLKNPSSYDELERSVSIFSPSEVILISPFDKKETDLVIQYSGIQTSMIHRIDIRDKNNEKIQNSMKQKYIKAILSTFYGDDVYNTCNEFNMNEIATQSFCYLLDFMKEHNPNLVKKIDLPDFNNSSDRVLLLNHTINQLNIIDDYSNDGKSCGHLSSVLSFLNKCSCSMGKRLFKKQLLNPTFNEEWIKKEYQMIEIMRNVPKEFILLLRKKLGQIKDIEKICRQMVLQKLYPSSIYHLYYSIQTIIELTREIEDLPDVIPYLCQEFIKNLKEPILDLCSQLLKYIENNLMIESCKGVNTVQHFDENIICKGVSTRLDDLINKNECNENVFKWIRIHLNSLLNESASKVESDTTEPKRKTIASKNETQEFEKSCNIEYVKEHITEKSGKSLVITKKRGITLKNILNKIAISNDPFLKINRDSAIPNDIKIHAKDIKIINHTTSNDEISNDTIHQISKELLHFKDFYSFSSIKPF